MNGIQKIEQHFKQQKAFIGYLTAGDGGIQQTLNSALALIDGGVNMLEIGVPFSDPIADGPVIQRASARALAAGTTLQDILELTESIRKKSAVPLILFSYVNPILAALQTSFFKEAQQAGIDGMLLVDCPIEETADYHDQCLMHDIAPIYVIAPSTKEMRIHMIDQYGKGFLYYACRKGTTGIRNDLPEDFCENIKMIKANTHLPIITGFGISTREAAKQVLQYAEGVVVGSLFVKALEEGMETAELTKLATRINPLI